MTEIGYPFTPSHALAFIGDVAGPTSTAVIEARALLRLDPDMSLADLIARSLSDTDRLIYLDWAAGVRECAVAFNEVFKVWGIDGRDAMRQLATSAPERGWAVKAAYDLFQPLAVELGMSFVSVGGAADFYNFVLTTRDVAERWTSVQINQYDWIAFPDSLTADTRKPAPSTMIEWP